MAKRNRLEIINDILMIVRKFDGIRITPLIRKSNLSTAQFKKYFDEILEKGFVEEKQKGKEKLIFIREKGISFILKYRNIISFIEEFDL